MRVGVLGIGGGTVGMTTYQRTLLDGLREMTSYDVSLVAPADDIAYELGRSGPIRAFKNFVGSPDARLQRAVAHSRADVFIVNAAWPMPRSVKRRIAVVAEAVVDEVAPWGRYRSSHKRLWTKYLFRAIDGADGIVAISEFTRARLHEAAGVPLERIAVAPPALLGFDGAPPPAFPPFVAMVGWFHPRKDLPLALRAWRTAMERGLDRDLVLAGSEGPDDRIYGSVRRRIIEIAGPELAPRVHHTGPLERPDLGAILEASDALLITSAYEGFGIPAIEAFSFGTPVVAVDRGALRESVAPHGAVVEPEAPALADALVRCVREPANAPQLITYARSFDVARQVGPIIALLDRISSSR
jgi:glycosyltransferase involved in cell wall biosynthesis